MEMLVKDLVVGNSLYALLKGEDLKYLEGLVTNIGVPRTDLPKLNGIYLPIPRTVVDLTFNLDDKTYTEVVDTSSYMFPTNLTGIVTLVATSVEPIVKELRASLKVNEDYLKETEKGIPSAKKKIEQCKLLISLLDTEFAWKQQSDQRISKLEAASEQTNNLLQQILNKLK